MIPTVLDANVLVSGFPSRDGSTAEVLQRGLLRRYQLVTSEHIIAAMLRAWERPYWSVRFPPPEQIRSVSILCARATVVTPDVSVRGVATHHEDDIVLGTAVAGFAAYLVTGDHDLQRIGRFRGITIVAPSSFISILDEQEAAPA